MATQKDGPPFWERIVAFLGLILVLGSLGFLLYEGVWGDNSPPDVVVELVRIRDSGDDYLVEFKASNEGGKTAADVRITATLTRDGREVEEAEASLDYVPAGSEQRGGLFFRNDPNAGELELRASGYQVP